MRKLDTKPLQGNKPKFTARIAEATELPEPTQTSGAADCKRRVARALEHLEEVRRAADDLFVTVADILAEVRDPVLWTCLRNRDPLKAFEQRAREAYVSAMLERRLGERELEAAALGHAEVSP